MKKFFAIVAMAVACLTANAQQQEAGTFSLMPKVGLGYASLTDMDDMGDYAVNILGGVEGKYQISDVFGLSLGLEYAYEHCTKAYSEIRITADGYKIGGDDVNPKMSLFNIPVLAHFNFGNHFGAKVGVQPGFLCSASDGLSTDTMESFQFGIPVGISWTFNSPFVLEYTYTIPVTKTFKGGDTKNNAMWLTLGYRIDM